MILKAYYAGGRIDVFDTDHLVDRVPQPGNLLANYTLDLADARAGGLWLRSYYHEAAEPYRGEPGPAGLPVARRRDGWSFLVADAEDLARLNRLTLDGETVLVRMAGELADASALRWAYDAAEEYAPMAVAAHGRASREALASGASESDVCASLGLSPGLYARVATDAIGPDRKPPRF